MHSIRILRAGIFLHFTFAFLSFACASDVEFILLKSGRVLQGKTSAVRRDTRIEFDKGDYVVIPTVRIEKKFQSQRDLTKYKTAVTPLDSVNQNRLLGWLLEQKQFDFALAQVEECRNANIRIDYEKWRQEILHKKSRANGLDQLQSNQSMDRKAPALTPSNGKHSSAHGKADTKLTSQKNGSLQQVAKHQFVNLIQNHLVMGCAVSGCHAAPSQNSFQLESNFARPLSDTQTANNFESVRKYLTTVDSAKKFITKLAEPHGRLKTGVFPSATVEYLKIATWVNSQPKKFGTPVTHPLVASKKQTQPTLAGSRPASVPVLRPGQSNATPKAQHPIVKPKESLADVANGSFDEFVPRDEFDPQIFNRLQEAKWAEPEPKKTEPVETVSQTPSRLISPAINKSKNR